MPESVKDLNFQERDIRHRSLGFGALAVHGKVVQYTVAPKSLFPEGEKVTRYDDDMVLVSSSVPTQPKNGALSAETQTQLIRNFIIGERILDGRVDVVQPTFMSLEDAREQAEQARLPHLSEAA